MDQCSIQLELVLLKKERTLKTKTRPKHPTKLHVWGIISTRGAACIVIFTGINDAVCFGQILNASLIPFIEQCFPNGYRFQMDNDPKHRSVYIDDYFKISHKLVA